MGCKRLSQMLVGSLAKRRLCLGPASVINCTPLSALSFWASLFPRNCGYNILRECFSEKATSELSLLDEKEPVSKLQLGQRSRNQYDKGHTHQGGWTSRRMEGLAGSGHEFELIASAEAAH